MSRVFSLVVVFAALLVLASAQSSSSTGAASSSSGSNQQSGLTVCQNYSGGAASTAASQQNLLTAIVTRAALGTNGTAVNGYVVSGLFNASGPLYYIFSGKQGYRSGAPDYTVFNSTAQNTLAGKLVAYFGALFGCTATGYPTVSNSDMYAVHANMNINSTHENYFNQQLAYTLLSFGVDPLVVNGPATTILTSFYQCAPPLSSTAYPGISSSASSGRAQICGTADCGYGAYSASAGAANCLQYYYSSTGAGTGAAAAQYGASAALVIVLAVISALLL